MKKFKPIGTKIKALREQLVRGSTQKELAYEVGVSERMLRNIENTNAQIPRTTLDRLAKALGVHCREIAFALDTPQLVVATPGCVETVLSLFEQDQLIPRFEETYAYAITDEAQLFSECRHSHVVDCIIKTKLNDETDVYAQKLFEIQGLLIEARHRGMRIKRLALVNSGDTAGDRRAVVGYGVWALR